MSTLLASAASNRLEALARRLFAGLLVLSFLEAVSNQFAQREYFNMASDVALAAMAIAVAGVAVSAWGPKSRNNFWLWAYAGSSLSAILFLPIMKIGEFPGGSEFEPWVWWTVGTAAISAGITDKRIAYTVFLPVICIMWFFIHLFMVGGEQAWLSGLKNVLYVFLLAGGTIGLIVLARDWARGVDSASSNLISSHIEKAKSEAVEKEEQLIDSLIHDSVLHTFITSANAKSNAEKKASAKLASYSIAKLQQLERVDQQVGSVTVLGLFQAIKNAARAMDESVEVELKAGGLDRITVEVGQALTEATLQAVDNAISHSNATKIAVTLDSQVNSEIEIQVVDNGIGFRPQRLSEDRLGIRISILAKMEIIGGKADVVSSPKAGTSVTLRWPK